MSNPSILAAFDRMWQHVVYKLDTKVSKVVGKDLSTNDYTDEEKKKWQEQNVHNNGEVTGENIAEIKKLGKQVAGVIEGKA